MAELFGNPDETQTIEAPTKTGGDQSTSTPPTETYADQLGLIVREDGHQKYADVQSALQSIPHAQAEINRLKGELEQATAQAAEAKGIDQVLEQLASQKSQEQVQQPTGQNLTQEQILELMNQTLTQKEHQAKQTTNAKVVEDALIGSFGTKEKANEKFEEKAKELGMDVATFTDLALNYPSVVLTHFKTNKAPVVQPTQGNINPQGLPNKEQEKELQPVPLGATTNDLINSYRAHAKQED